MPLQIASSRQTQPPKSKGAWMVEGSGVCATQRPSLLSYSWIAKEQEILFLKQGARASSKIWRKSRNKTCSRNLEQCLLLKLPDAIEISAKFYQNVPKIYVNFFFLIFYENSLSSRKNFNSKSRWSFLTIKKNIFTILQNFSIILKKCLRNFPNFFIIFILLKNFFKICMEFPQNFRKNSWN